MSLEYEEFKRLLTNTIYTAPQSWYDNFVETNCRLRSMAGMKEMIIRRELGSCCDWCKGLAGIYEYGKQPKEVFMRHTKCRCMVTFKNENGYTDVWSKNTKASQRAARIEREKTILDELSGKIKYVKDDGLYQRHNLPSGYNDTRNVGNLITEEELKELRIYADKHSVVLGSGFKEFRGDQKQLKQMIDELEKQQISPLIGKPISGVILDYGYVLGYRKDENSPIDKSMIDINAFAETRKKRIILNKFMFDDLSQAKNAYANDEKRGFYVRNSNILNVVTHEFGHIIDTSYPYLYQKVMGIITKQVGKELDNIAKYIFKEVSEYASTVDEDDDFKELMPELNTMLNIKKDNGIVQLIKAEGLINEIRPM